MPTDIEIASSATPRPIAEIALRLGVPASATEQYGHHKAKINFCKPQPKAKLVLVSAITPTPLGEGKTTVSIGLADGFSAIGKKVCVALREPSLGPVFGIKGGAAGGGYAQVIPMDEINLHFTGDIHAISAANNLLAALLDNHLQQGNQLKIHPKRISWKRCIDLNDRALRNIVIGLGGEKDGIVRDDGFNITAASEVMAILCLARDLADLKKRLGNILVAFNFDGEPVYARDLKAENAMAILLKEAFKPNLVQTLEGTPALIHGGPFANIAHGCNSVSATLTAMNFADYVVTEAGFGADLGAEKFLDIKCRQNGIAPSCVVIVATVRALKMHGGVAKSDLAAADAGAVSRGCDNLRKHLENITQVFRLKAVVAINRFASDTKDELSAVVAACEDLGVKAVLTDVHALGGEGGKALAAEVARVCDDNPTPSITHPYALEDGIKDKISAVCQKIYGAGKVIFLPKAKAEIDRITALGYAKLPVVIAKTQYSFSEDASAVGRPSGFTINIREVQLRAGSGFIVAVAGDIMLMPGLPKTPAADNMIINDDGTISGLS